MQFACFYTVPSSSCRFTKYASAPISMTTCPIFLSFDSIYTDGALISVSHTATYPKIPVHHYNSNRSFQTPPTYWLKHNFTPNQMQHPNLLPHTIWNTTSPAWLLTLTHTQHLRPCPSQRQKKKNLGTDLNPFSKTSLITWVKHPRFHTHSHMSQISSSWCQSALLNGSSTLQRYILNSILAGNTLWNSALF